MLRTQVSGFEGDSVFKNKQKAICGNYWCTSKEHFVIKIKQMSSYCSKMYKILWNFSIKMNLSIPQHISKNTFYVKKLN